LFPVVAFLLCAGAIRADEVGARFLHLVRDRKVAETLVAPDDGAPIWDEAVAALTTTAARWGGLTPRVVRLAKGASLPAR
jgi:hypothetical protein